ncbi:MAG: MaoC family dehydratase N-terminal domain-containing protein [Deltaproteobacteria bacterium]|nr:MaoC family dehydratase N-terminal domain-containing protein [Deltaproteobacteria bacterium]
MSEALPLGIDAALLGVEFDSSVSPPVTAQEIHEYAASLGESHPVYFAPEPVAPPTFCMKFRGNRFSPPALPRRAFARSFDAGKDIQFGAPIRAGDVIHTSNVLHEVYEKTGRSGAMVFIVSRLRMKNQRGEMVAVIDSRFLIRGEAAT